MDETQGTLPGIPARVGVVEERETAPRVGLPPRLKPIDRTQLLLRSVVVEQLICEDHPARAIWEIVDIEATQAGSDYRQLTPALDRVEQHLDHAPDQVVVDGGYISSDNIVAMAERGIDLVGPEPTTPGSDANRQKSYRHRGVTADYEASQFHYEATTNTYVCPQGQRLTSDAKERRAGTMHYRYKAAKADCDACPVKLFCCPRTRHGRSVERMEPLPAITAFRQKMETADARAIYRTRSQVAECPNLWIKAKLGLRQFRVRGLAKVTLESLWAALTYDIQQWIRLRWRSRLSPLVSA